MAGYNNWSGESAYWDGNVFDFHASVFISFCFLLFCFGNWFWLCAIFLANSVKADHWGRTGLLKWNHRGSCGNIFINQGGHFFTWAAQTHSCLEDVSPLSRRGCLFLLAPPRVLFTRHGDLLNLQHDHSKISSNTFDLWMARQKNSRLRRSKLCILHTEMASRNGFCVCLLWDAAVSAVTSAQALTPTRTQP